MRRRARWRTIAAVVGAVVVGPWLVFVIVANALLATGGIEAIVTGPTAYSTLEFRHGRAWTLWPTRVHVRDARLAVDAWSFDFDLHVPEATVDLRLLDLFDRRVHFERIDATGVEAHWRSKPPRPRGRRPREQAWGVDLDAVDAYVARLTIDAIDTAPCGRVRGGLHWTSGHELMLPPTTVALEAAGLRIGERELAQDMWGGAGLGIEEYSTWDTPAREVPTHLAFAVRATGRVHDPAAIEHWAPRVAGLVGRGGGQLDVEVSARAGQLLAGSRLHYRTAGIDLGPAVLWMSTAADVTIAVGEQGHPRARVELADTRIVAGDREIGRAADVRASFTADHAGLTRRWLLAAARADADAIEIDDLSTLARIAPDASFRPTGGSAKVRGTAELDPLRGLVARLAVDLNGAGLAGERASLEGDASLRGTLRLGHWRGLVVDRLRGTFDGVAVTTDHGEQSVGKGRIRDGELRVHDGEFEVDVSADLDGRDVSLRARARAGALEITQSRS